ncbi:hypothetical protein Lal_00000170 [Lupinus albus]|uniref:Putative bifunctional inhibitor/plant lipid transfer protein/seed storage helical n=1 Tax=Lupinus albus TaxID=3870 RepID=A0A6A5LHS6_LUPAL|nr:putative bifunctional inhibitor/plant lipid transfer protein/seed storage helical [Lupinus albus]KAF1860757.1 hypothetical protein Lal_00000170 [Lupinus albus]
MKKVKIFNLITLGVTFLVLVPKIESQIRPSIGSLPPAPPRPLCASQFALVNYACAMLSFTPGSADNDNGHSSHQHGHGHRHDHGHRRGNTPEEENCCRWVREMDSQCVCEILFRLPPFLTRPVHQYTVLIGESCDVTYNCGGPI